MILRTIILLHWLLLASGDGRDRSSPRSKTPSPPDVCLTGYMTDVQKWVSGRGDIVAYGAGGQSIDVSRAANATALLRERLTRFRSSEKAVWYLSMAKCRLTSIPMVFRHMDQLSRPLFSTLRYLTFYGNQFEDPDPLRVKRNWFMNKTSDGDIQNDKFAGQLELQSWESGFLGVTFPDLRELDLRSCSIHHLNDDIFTGMPQLKSLYLSENSIYSLRAETFMPLGNLVHLDLSRNSVFDYRGSKIAMSLDSFDGWLNKTNLVSLDLSFTKLSQTAADILKGLGSQFQRLSVCYTGIKSLRAEHFANTSLKYLDVSGNNGILNDVYSLQGVKDTLKILFANNILLRDITGIEEFTRLLVLKLSNNEITHVAPRVARSLKGVKILDLDNNKISSWHQKTFNYMNDLKILSLRDNNINVVQPEMLDDFKNITYLALSGNFFVCSCNARELFEIAAKNEHRRQLASEEETIFDRPIGEKSGIDFHRGFRDYRNIVLSRLNIDVKCDGTNKRNCTFESLGSDGNYLLLDYDINQYRCLAVEDGTKVPFCEVTTCRNTKRDWLYDDVIKSGWNKLIAIIIVPSVLVPCMIVGFLLRRKIRYFFITFKNSAMLSLIDQAEGYEDGTIFTYDVFVSYCNEDRPWVLDHLLPHVEDDCNVTVCLHERDFQVGLSILENIVSCMDRSRSIVLVISQQFLRSQWCQFEMHLAQHRLLETRREDLILILLEDIPRRLRPTTLHYLMMTKTYLLWPKDQSTEVFWKRLKKTLVTRTLRKAENVSLA